ncbi:TetR/AcrR family transcriptional regulator [Actinocorallia sp. API 0066]|uniref:TetR/AcrR family transcriptional regulator n=1 Tax=Actinocorallia sp. API 0066 TaxID=2896846 RepID=UPI001E447A9A|nr:TetR/AcrR family transcriptional regulator [Actinocorallia sp. API 0066]MCD0449513.1 TetR/AcrR family transcriptional regulator [Actinocorallia sp. API 0066]
MAYRATEATRRNAELKRRAFLRAARSLVAAHGFGGATVQAIAAESGASVGSVYSYFDGREDLLAEVFRSAAGHELGVVRDAAAGAGEGAVARLDALVRTFAGRALQGRQMAWSLLFEPVTPAVEAERLVYRSSYTGLLAEIVGDGVAEGVFAAQDVALAASAVLGAISEALIGGLRPGDRPAASAEADAAIVEGIRLFCFRALGTEETL